MESVIRYRNRTRQNKKIRPIMFFFACRCTSSSLWVSKLLVVGNAFVGKLVVAFDIDERVFSEYGRSALGVDRIHQVRLGPEWSETGLFEGFPPFEDACERPIPSVNFDLQLSKRQRLSFKCLQKVPHRVKFSSLNIDFQDVDKFVTVGLHDGFERPLGWVGGMVVLAGDEVLEEVGARAEEGDRFDFGTKLRYAEVKPKYFAALCASEQRGLK